MKAILSLVSFPRTIFLSQNKILTLFKTQKHTAKRFTEASELG
jgi:hypothetical protein